jgi:hypothetical protein
VSFGFEQDRLAILPSPRRTGGSAPGQVLSSRQKVPGSWVTAPKTYRAEHPLAHYFNRNFWLTTSCNFRNQTLIDAILEIGADRVLFSTDWPFENVDHAATWFDHASVSEADRQKSAAPTPSTSSTSACNVNLQGRYVAVGQQPRLCADVRKIPHHPISDRIS